jgi:hypothetical protein
MEVKATPGQKAIHYLHMGQQPSKQKKLYVTIRKRSVVLVSLMMTHVSRNMLQ